MPDAPCAYRGVGSRGGIIDSIMRDAPQLFPVFFVLMWLAVTSTLGLVSGWYALSGFYPNRDEPPLLSLRMQSGSMRWVGMRSILNLDVCPSGLRVGMMRLFGVFCRDFFVPWDQISVVRNDRLFWREAKLVFGQPANGSLKLQAEVANRLARAAGARWPEVGPFPAETDQAALQRLGKEWAEDRPGSMAQALRANNTAAVATCSENKRRRPKSTAH